MKNETILILNNNMNIGGVQKSLVDFLKELDKTYDCTLLLFAEIGPYLNELPSSVHIKKANSLYKCLGVSYDESKANFFLFFFRLLMAIIFKFIGRSFGMKVINASQRTLHEHYDVAISFFQNSGNSLLYGGTNDFVLSKVKATQKITFLHCDYRNCGSHCDYNDHQYYRFDKIAACSEGCRNAFLEVLPDLANKTFTVRNCHDYPYIMASATDYKKYNHAVLNVVSVARLSIEKGIDRAIKAVKYAVDNGVKICYHLVGGGPDSDTLAQMAKDLGISENVCFYGNQSNPFQYVKDADLMLIPSYHEAAPLVIDEARCLGVPILSTATTSTIDMVVNTHSGWMCANDQDSLNKSFYEVLSDTATLTDYKRHLSSIDFNNDDAVSDFQIMLTK